MTERAAKQLASQLVPQTPAAGVQPAQPTDPKLTMMREALGFLSRQHPAYLTLWALLIAIGSATWFGGSYVINTAVPAHLASIKAGYKELWEKHLEDKQATEAAHREHMSQAIGEMKRGNELLESLIREFALERRKQAGAAVAIPGDGS